MGPQIDAVFQPRRQLGQGGQHRGAESLVAPFDDADLESDLSQHQRQRAAALSAAPAISQRLPAAGLVDHLALDVPGDIGGHQRGAALLRFERADLLVDRAYELALLVVE